MQNPKVGKKHKPPLFSASFCHIADFSVLISQVISPWSFHRYIFTWVFLVFFMYIFFLLPSSPTLIFSSKCCISEVEYPFVL